MLQLENNWGGPALCLLNEIILTLLLLCTASVALCSTHCFADLGSQQVQLSTRALGHLRECTCNQITIQFSSPAHGVDSRSTQARRTRNAHQNRSHCGSRKSVCACPHGTNEQAGPRARTKDVLHTQNCTCRALPVQICLMRSKDGLQQKSYRKCFPSHTYPATVSRTSKYVRV